MVIGFVRRHWKWAVTLLFGVAVFFFWNCLYPQSLSYHEQKQLFLWTWGYLATDLSVAGGLADWLSEFMVQFYYVIWLGALCLALFFIAFQRLSYLVFADLAGSDGWIVYMLSYVLPIVMILLMGDINLMTAFPVAVVLSLLAVWMMNKAASKCKRSIWLDILLIPIIYWAVGGGCTWLYLVLRLIFILRNGYGRGIDRKLMYCCSFLYLLCLQVVADKTLLQQWPQKSVYLGLNYYLVPMKYPGEKIGYDATVYELLMQDYLVRNERWDDIIERAEKYQVTAVFSSNCINLALAQKGQLADRMFEFYQTGDDALLLHRVRDNMSTYPTMEAFWRLGLVNSCLRYAADLQESILNARKSGRLTKRLAECYMVNGNYPAAKKNIDLLKHSLFYRKWAKEAGRMLGNEALINNHPVYGKVRRLRFKNDMMFSYREKHKILGQLFMNNPQNRMALSYFLGELLLRGDHNMFLHYLPWAKQYGGYLNMPWGYQDAVKAIETRGALKNSPYAEYGKRQSQKQMAHIQVPEMEESVK